MTEQHPTWSGWPEERIIRELHETRIGGTEPGTDSVGFGRIFETILIRELQKLVTERSDVELRFGRGYIVDDYGHSESGEVSVGDDETVEKSGPRFDIVCYHGNVAWTTFDSFPAAVVPKSLAAGIIEVKRTVSPQRFGPDSNEYYNKQLSQQRDYLNDLNIDVPHIVVAAHYFGEPKDNRRRALADHVALFWDLNIDSSDSKHTRSGEIAAVIDILTGETSSNTIDEKTKHLQDIASNLQDNDGEDEEW